MNHTGTADVLLCLFLYCLIHRSCALMVITLSKLRENKTGILSNEYFFVVFKNVSAYHIMIIGARKLSTAFTNQDILGFSTITAL